MTLNLAVPLRYVVAAYFTGRSLQDALVVEVHCDYPPYLIEFQDTEGRVARYSVMKEPEFAEWFKSWRSTWAKSNLQTVTTILNKCGELSAYHRELLMEGLEQRLMDTAGYRLPSPLYRNTFDWVDDNEVKGWMIKQYPYLKDPKRSLVDYATSIATGHDFSDYYDGMWRVYRYSDFVTD